MGHRSPKLVRDGRAARPGGDIDTPGESHPHGEPESPVHHAVSVPSGDPHVGAADASGRHPGGRHTEHQGVEQQQDAEHERGAGVRCARSAAELSSAGRPKHADGGATVEVGRAGFDEPLQSGGDVLQSGAGVGRGDVQQRGRRARFSGIPGDDRDEDQTEWVCKVQSWFG